MRVLINAISIAEGGGMIVLKNLLEEMQAIAPEVNWFVACHPAVGSQLPQNKPITCLTYPWVKKSFLHHFYWYESVLPRLVKKKKIDVCFSQTNFLPRRKLTCPSLLLLQHAGYFSETFKQLYLDHYPSRKNKFIWQQKYKWVRQSIRNATYVTVQTQALANKVITNLGINKVAVIPHGLGFVKNALAMTKDYVTKSIWRIGYVTKFGVQKRF